MQKEVINVICSYSLYKLVKVHLKCPNSSLTYYLNNLFYYNLGAVEERFSSIFIRLISTFI